MREEDAIEVAVEAWNRSVDELVERLTPDVELHAPPGFLTVTCGRVATPSLTGEMSDPSSRAEYKVEDRRGQGAGCCARVSR